MDINTDMDTVGATANPTNIGAQAVIAVTAASAASALADDTAVLAKAAKT